MLEIIAAAWLIVAAWWFGKRQGRKSAEAEQGQIYHDTKSRIDSVTRADGDSVVDRLREHADK